MSIAYAILGFLSWQPLAGYDLKKLIADSEFLPWSGNNNQIYTTLTQLHRNELVSLEVYQQENLPPRKVYSITERGREELRKWVFSAPEVPESRSSFLIQLAWADQLAPQELDGLVASYAHELEMQLAMLREKKKRGLVAPARTTREAFLWETIHENRVKACEAELTWVGTLREGLTRLEKPQAKKSRR